MSYHIKIYFRNISVRSPQLRTNAFISCHCYIYTASFG